MLNRANMLSHRLVCQRKFVKSMLVANWILESKNDRRRTKWAYLIHKMASGDPRTLWYVGNLKADAKKSFISVEMRAGAFKGRKKSVCRFYGFQRSN
jgi:hypothetical protein